MTPDMIVSAAADISIGILSLALILTAVRVVRGPTLPDRVLSLDMLVAVAIGFIVVIAIRSGFTLYIDIAIALGLAIVGIILLAGGGGGDVVGLILLRLARLSCMSGGE